MSTQRQNNLQASTAKGESRPSTPRTLREAHAYVLRDTLIEVAVTLLYVASVAGVEFMRRLAGGRDASPMVGMNLWILELTLMLIFLRHLLRRFGEFAKDARDWWRSLVRRQ